MRLQIIKIKSLLIKILAISVLLTTMLVISSKAQIRVKLTSNGQFQVIQSDTTKRVTGGIPTGKYITLKDKQYEIYQGSKGGLYILRISEKDGKTRKTYLKQE